MSNRPTRIAGGVVRQLMSYPLKGCAGISHSSVVVSAAGLAHDRSFMAVNPDGVFRSQGRDPRLATVQPQISADGSRLTLSAPGAGSVHLAVDLDAPRREVVLAGLRLQGIDQGDAVAGWLSDVLGVPSRLVRVPPEHGRVSTGQTPGTCGYADSCAIHLISQSTLDLLNQRLRRSGAAPLPMSRFRPNVVVGGWVRPHTEDSTWRVRTGGIEMGYAEPAIRCVVTTVDQHTGERTGPEPLRTLATYRRIGDGIAFGANFAVMRPGEISVGDEVIVSQRATPSL
jgi:uncharacterized protein YcbX